MDNKANVTEQVKEQELHQQQQLQGKKHPKHSTMIDWKSAAETQQRGVPARERSGEKKVKIHKEFHKVKGMKTHDMSFWCSRTSSCRP